MLDALPSDLLDMVVGQISSRRDPKHLCEVCTRLRDRTIPYLYQSVVLSAPETSLGQLATTMEVIPRRYMQYTQEFGFSMPIHEQIDSRCVHRNSNGQELTELMDEDDFSLKRQRMTVRISEYTDPNIAELSGVIFVFTYFPYIRHMCIKIVQDNHAGHFFNLVYALDSLQFRDDQLRSFRWELGTCIPKVLLSSSELSPLKNQESIQSITLITDGECGTDLRSQYSVDLVQFKDLRTLVWKGPQWPIRKLRLEGTVNISNM